MWNTIRKMGLWPLICVQCLLICPSACMMRSGGAETSHPYIRDPGGGRGFHAYGTAIRAGSRNIIAHASHPIPFHYENNCLLCFPATHRKKAPYKQNTDRVARQIQELINTDNGHTLVLFTSYDQMGRVYEKLKDKFPVPVLQAQRNPQIYLNASNNFPTPSCSPVERAGKVWISPEIWSPCSSL